MDDPSMMPDLSHLSAEEREIIEQVFKRQKDEEAKEVQISQKADAELDQIERQINERKETARRLVGTQDDAICQICQKTKFADGIGHKCFYCQLRSCARCGGRAQSKNKAIWACSLCQKRQQILAKTGKWFQPDEPISKLSLTGQESPCQSMSPIPSTSTPTLNVIAPPSQNTGPKGNGSQVQQFQRSTGPTQRHPSSQTGNRQGENGPNSISGTNGHSSQRSSERTQQGDVRRQNTLHRQPSLTEQGNGSLPQQRSTQVVRQQEANRSTEMAKTKNQAVSNRVTIEADRIRDDKRRHSTNLRGKEERKPPVDNRSLLFTENDSRTTENKRSERSVERRHSSYVPRKEYKEPYNDRSERHHIEDCDHNKQLESRENRSSSPVRNGPFDTKHTDDYSSSHYNNIPSAPSTTSRNPEFRRTRSIREDDTRRGSIGVSLQPAEAQTVSSSTSTVHRTKKSRLHRQIQSMSSSEEDLPSTSEFLGGEESVQRVPNECTSEKDLLRYIYGSEKIKNGRKTGTVTRHQREMSRSPCRSTGMGAVIPGDVLAAKIRTYLSHPVTWQPSADQRRLIGHMVLHKTDSAANGDLGLKVVGGRRSDTGRLGAFITRVKAGSVADTVGRLRAGDEVLEWNGQALQNATFDQVYEIISASKHESQVEIIVSRSSSVPGGDDFLNVQIPARQLPNPQYFLTDPDMYCSPSASPLVPYHALSHSQSAIIPQMQAQLSPRHRASMAGYYSDIGVPFVPELSYGRGQIFGRIELSLYFSHHDRQLTVTVERAIDLPPRPDGIPRNPYVKVFLLPDRSEKSRRQTAVLAEALIPVWSESFFYPGITESMLMERVLEVTVWDYDKYEANSFLGETLVDFTAVPLDGQPLLYTLVDMDDENPLRTRLRHRKISEYSGLPLRPRSEMGYGGRQPTVLHLDPYSDPYDVSPRGQMDSLMRRSRTYDRAGINHGRGTPVRLEEDWNINNQSGYLSDHGYSQQQPAPRYRQRRPRSATAMRPMTAAEMSASRMYNRNLPEQPYDESDGTPEARFPPSHLSSWFPPNDPRSPNGRLMMEAMQEQQGYGSDGSETMSTHSAHSMPVVRTINRRCPLPNGSSDLQETSLDNYITDDISAMNSGSAVKTSASSMNMEKRKKSMITRFIPGRGAGGADGKRTGFARSEEVGIPGNLSTDRLQTQIMKQASKDSTDSAHSDNWVPVLPDGPLGTFVDNLGPGQVVGRQVLASPVLGEIQIGIMAGRSGIDVEIIRAKNLVVKPGVKINPAPYVKVYLMEGKMCVAKAKTNPVRKTTAPLFQQHLIFNDTPKRKMLQITVLGDYGRMERKTFMGIAQIRLDDLELGPEPVIGWYKLYHSSSLAGTGPIRKDSETSLVGGQ